MLSMPERDVRVIYVEDAGCYGRNGHEDAAADAVLLARAVGRRCVQWMRADEQRLGPQGPPTLIDLQPARRDRPGARLSSQFSSPRARRATSSCSHRARHLPARPGSIRRHPQRHGDPVWLRQRADRRAPAATTPLRPSWIRSPGRLQNTFANESFMDELASAVQVDPIAFRLRYLDDPRRAEVLKRLARRSWSAAARAARDRRRRHRPRRLVREVRACIARTSVPSPRWR